MRGDIQISEYLKPTPDELEYKNGGMGKIFSAEARPHSAAGASASNNVNSVVNLTQIYNMFTEFKSKQDDHHDTSHTTMMLVYIVIFGLLAVTVAKYLKKWYNNRIENAITRAQQQINNA